ADQVLVGRDRRRARLEIEQREFAEHGARGERDEPRFAVAAGQPHAPAGASWGDDVEVAVIVALPENHLSLAIDAAQQHGADDRQVLLLQAREYIEPAKRVLLRDAGTLRP